MGSTRVKLCWQGEFGCVRLVSARIPYRKRQAVFAQVAIKQGESGEIFLGWDCRWYGICLMHSDIGRPRSMATVTKNTFVQATKIAETVVRDYFKSMGFEVDIEPFQHSKELPYTLKYKTNKKG